MLASTHAFVGLCNLKVQTLQVMAIVRKVKQRKKKKIGIGRKRSVCKHKRFESTVSLHWSGCLSDTQVVRTCLAVEDVAGNC